MYKNKTKRLNNKIMFYVDHTFRTHRFTTPPSKQTYPLSYAKRLKVMRFLRKV